MFSFFQLHLPATMQRNPLHSYIYQELAHSYLWHNLNFGLFLKQIIKKKSLGYPELKILTLKMAPVENSTNK